MSWLVKSRAYGVGSNLQQAFEDGDEKELSTTVGGRIDVAKLFDDIKVRSALSADAAPDTAHACARPGCAVQARALQVTISTRLLH
jgi:hypothetical protein